MDEFSGKRIKRENSGYASVSLHITEGDPGTNGVDGFRDRRFADGDKVRLDGLPGVWVVIDALGQSALWPDCIMCRKTDEFGGQDGMMVAASPDKVRTAERTT